MIPIYNPNDPNNGGGGGGGVSSGSGGAPISGSSVNYAYLPLLEGKAGKVYIQNPSAPGFYFAGVPGGLGVFSPTGFLGSGALAVSPSSSSSYQGRLTIAENSLNTNDKKFELQYNGSVWDSTTADDFFLEIVTKDTAYSNGVSFDLYEFSPGPPPGSLDVYTERRGGSNYQLFVWALSVPTPITFTPSVIPADGQPHIITVSLATRLHSTQNPNMQFQLVGTGAPTVTLGSPVAIRNNAGQITGYSISATASAQPSGTATWRLTAFETLTYLKNDVIVSELVNYYTNQNLSSTLTISGNSTLMAVAGTSLRSGTGTDTYWGKLETGVPTPRMAGGVVAEVLLTSGEPFGSEVVEVYLKQGGQNARTPWVQWQSGAFTGTGTGTHVDGTTLSGSGGLLYTRTLSFNLNLAPMTDWTTIDIGYTLTNAAASGVALASGFFNSSPIANGNLIRGLNGYNVQLWAGATVPGEWDSGTWAPSQPTFAGVITAYLSEHWSAYDTGATNYTAPFFDTIEYQIDGGAWVSLDPNTLSTSMLASTFSGGGGGGGGIDGCVPYGTLIATPNGVAEIQTLSAGVEVSGFDEVTLDPVLTTVEELIRYDNRQLYELKTANASLVCSHDHRLTQISRIGQHAYPAARDLKVGDYIFRFADGKMLLEQLTEVNPLEQYVSVYHLKLKDGHVFVAGGFPAHNMKSKNLIM